MSHPSLLIVRWPLSGRFHVWQAPVRQPDAFAHGQDTALKFRGITICQVEHVTANWERYLNEAIETMNNITLAHPKVEDCRAILPRLNKAFETGNFFQFYVSLEMLRRLLGGEGSGWGPGGVGP